MAYNQLSSSSQTTSVSLTECWICLSEMENPKALPCLHSFCLACLKKVVNPPGIFVCPLCKDKTRLPSDGVDGFKDNFLINQLKDSKILSRKGKILKSCVSCAAEGQEILARCMDCNGFLCHQCVNLHQTIKPLKVHKVFNIDELQSGQVDMGKATREEYCEQHADQALRWFCETCNIPICRDCTVMEHVRPDHNYMTIENAYETQVKDIKSLIASCMGLIQQLTTSIANIEEAELNLAKSVDDIKKQLDKEKNAHIDAVEKSYMDMTDKLTQIRKEKFEKASVTKVDLQEKKTELTDAVMEANHAISSGSKHDLASNYSTLHKTLSNLQQMKINYKIGKNFSDIKYRPSSKSEIKVDLGSFEPKISYPKIPMPMPKKGLARYGATFTKQ